jgi:hypothetical protein
MVVEGKGKGLGRATSHHEAKSNQIKSGRARGKGHKVTSNRISSGAWKLGLFVLKLARKMPAFAFFLNCPCARPDSSKSANCWPENCA